MQYCTGAQQQQLVSPGTNTTLLGGKEKTVSVGSEDYKDNNTSRLCGVSGQLCGVLVVVGTTQKLVQNDLRTDVE